MLIRDFSGEELEQVAGESFLPVVARTRADFRGRFLLQNLGEAVTLTRTYSGGPLRTFRTDRMAARTSESDLMLFSVQEAGLGRVRQRDRLVELASGLGVMSEARSPWEFVSLADTQLLTLHFSRGLLPLHSTEITESVARRVDPQAPAMKMLSGYLRQLFELADGLTGEQRLDAGRAAVELLVMALRDVSPAVPGGDGSSDVLLSMMRTHVRDHLVDPLLTVEQLARRHHISARHAYALFAQIGTTPGAFIRRQRLLAARGMLSDPRYGNLGVSSIATAAGFFELRTFERAFRREYGMTPGGWRREHHTAGQG